MFARFGIILALLVQQVSFAAVVRLSADRDPVPCCQPVETTTCCGPRNVEVVCSVSQGACECVVQSVPTPDPVPPIPAPARTNSAAASITAFLAESEAAFSAFTARATIWQPRERIRGLLTHNQHLALLCVWRT